MRRIARSSDGSICAGSFSGSSSSGTEGTDDAAGDALKLGEDGAVETGDATTGCRLNGVTATGDGNDAEDAVFCGLAADAIGVLGADTEFAAARVARAGAACCTVAGSGIVLLC